MIADDHVMSCDSEHMLLVHLSLLLFVSISDPHMGTASSGLFPGSYHRAVRAPSKLDLGLVHWGVGSGLACWHRKTPIAEVPKSWGRLATVYKGPLLGL